MGASNYVEGRGCSPPSHPLSGSDDVSHIMITCILFTDKSWKGARSKATGNSNIISF